jgi:ribonuclease HI
METLKLTIWTDGACRGNPGPGATAFIIADASGKLLRQKALFIGTCTNNIAEYKALISAFEEAAKLAGDGGTAEIVCYSDSRLMISQMKGEFKVKQQHLKELREEAKSLERKFKKVEYVNVPRTYPAIQRADRMVNEVLDNALWSGKIR